MTSTSNKRSIDDLELEECCRSIKKLAVSPRGEDTPGAGDKITPSGPKIKKKPWRLQMQPKQTPKIKADQRICSPLKNLEDQISMMLKTIRYSIQSITGKETPDREDVSSSSLPIKHTKKHARQSRRKPYQRSRPDNAEDKDPAKDNPMIPSLPTVISPVNKKPRQSSSSKKIPILVPNTISTTPAAPEVALPTKDKKNTDKANQSITGNETLDRVGVSSSSLPIKHTKKHARQSRRKPYQKSRPDNAKDKDPAKDNPMTASLPTVINPVNKKPRQRTSSKKIPILVPNIISTTPAAPEIVLPTKDKKNTDKAECNYISHLSTVFQ